MWSKQSRRSVPITRSANELPVGARGGVARKDLIPVAGPDGVRHWMPIPEAPSSDENTPLEDFVDPSHLECLGK
jgi:hypothetical protein